MPKIKMSDVSSGSENVKALFRMSMEDRLKSIKMRDALTNDELLEVLTLSEKESHYSKRIFLQLLIQKQPGQFNSGVFNNYARVLFDKQSLLELLQKSDTGIQENSKVRWVQYVGVTDARWLIYDFIENNISIKYGIDAYYKPFNAIIANIMIQQILRQQSGPQRMASLPILFKLFDSMHAVELEQLYIEFKQVYVDVVFDIIMGYKKMPGSVIGTFFKATVQLQEKIAIHPNCPPDIKNVMYAKTKDTKYLPTEIIDIFCW